MWSCESLHILPAISRIYLLGNIGQSLRTPNILPIASGESLHLSRGAYSRTYLNKKEIMLTDVTPPQLMPLKIMARTFTLCTHVLRILLTFSLASQILTSLLRSFWLLFLRFFSHHFPFFLSLVSRFFFFGSLHICLSALHP